MTVDQFTSPLFCECPRCGRNHLHLSAGLPPKTIAVICRLEGWLEDPHVAAAGRGTLAADIRKAIELLGGNDGQ